MLAPTRRTPRVYVTLAYLAAACAAFYDRRACAQVSGATLENGPPRFLRPDRPLQYPEIFGSVGFGAEAVVTVTVDPTGRVMPETPRVTVLVVGDSTVGSAGWTSSGADIFGLAARDASRGWRFVPARAAGRPVAATVVVRVRFVPLPGPWRAPVASTCNDCDELQERTRERVRNASVRAAACATALREIARSDPTDTLTWAVEVAPRCERPTDAAALAARLMGYAYDGDSTLALRARLAARVPSAAVFDAALAVAHHAYPSARRYALAVLDQLAAGVPRDFAAATRAGPACGTFVLEARPPEDALVLSPAVRAAYGRPAYELAGRLAADTTLAASVRAAARCVAADLAPAPNAP